MGKGFKDLLVWRAARDLAVAISRVTNQAPFEMEIAFQIGYIDAKVFSDS